MIRRCKYCGRTDVPLSHRNICEQCGLRRMVQATLELHEHSGKFYDKWREAYMKAFPGRKIRGEKEVRKE